MLTGWISYTLGSAMRTFSEINAGKSFPSSENQTHELKLIAVTVTTASVIVSAVNVALAWAQVITPGFSRSALAIDWLLSLVMVGGTRFAMRLMAETGSPRSNGQGKKIIVIGAGDAGALVVKELQKNSQLNLEPIGFLDDDPAKQKHQIHGVPVIGTLPSSKPLLLVAWFPEGLTLWIGNEWGARATSL